MRLSLLFVVMLTLALLLIPTLLGVGTAWALTHPPCAPGGTPDSFITAFESIIIESTADLKLGGYFLPGTNGATVVVLPGFNAGRGLALNDGQILWAAGFNVLTLDSRACSALGRLSLGYYEVEDALAVLDYLERRGDVDMSRVGLHGFSSAGATALMTAARTDRARAVSAMGGYHDYSVEAGFGESADPLSSLYRFGLDLGYRLSTGTDIRNLSPYRTMDQIKARSVFLIYGSLEITQLGARRMLDKGLAAGLDIRLWIVPGAGHGDYLRASPVEYPQRLTAFYRETLLGE